MKLLIKNGRIIDPSQNLDETLDLLIVDGKIAETTTIYRGEADETLDTNGMVVSPGLIDLHVHLREPGYEYKETIRTGVRAAVAGGFTAVACMPNTSPPNDEPSITRFILEKAAEAGMARVYPIPAVTKGMAGEELAEMGLLKEAGAVGFSDDGLPVANSQTMRRALEYASGLDMPIIQHSEDLDLAAGGVMHEGAVSSRLGLKGIPITAESSMVMRDISLARLTGGHLHVAHVSAAESVRAIRQAKSEGIHVTAEVTPHHLFLTDEAVTDYDTNAKMKPPLRPEEERQALIDALTDGTIDCIASDHAPHHADEKDCPFDDAAFGIVGLETTLGLVIEKLVKPGIITLQKAIELLSAKPSSIFHLPGGTLKVGSPADIVIFSTSRSHTIDPSTFFSKGKNTPFAGWKVNCTVWATIIEGRIVFRDGQCS